MDDARITFDSDLSMERTTSYGTDAFVKERFKSADRTVDVSLVPLDGQDPDAYIEERRHELETMTVDVPSPYKGDIEQVEQNPEYALEFHDADPPYALGYADPEYRPMVAGREQIPRYQYVISWRYMPERDIIVEVEVFQPVEEDVASAIEIVESVSCREGGDGGTHDV